MSKKRTPAPRQQCPPSTVEGYYVYGEFEKDGQTLTGWYLMPHERVFAASEAKGDADGGSALAYQGRPTLTPDGDG